VTLCNKKIPVHVWIEGGNDGTGMSGTTVRQRFFACLSLKSNSAGSYSYIIQYDFTSKMLRFRLFLMIKSE